MSDIEEAFDVFFGRCVAEGHCTQQYVDSLTDTFASCKTVDELDRLMRRQLDRVIYVPAMLSYSVQGLVGRPELNGSLVEVLGPSKIGTDGKLRYPVRVCNKRTASYQEAILLRPQHLSTVLPAARNEDGDPAARNNDDGDQEMKEMEDAVDEKTEHAVAAELPPAAAETGAASAANSARKRKNRVTR